MSENYSLSPSMLSSKTNFKYSKKCAENEIIRLIIMKVRIKKKKRSHRYDITTSLVKIYETNFSVSGK